MMVKQQLFRTFAKSTNRIIQLKADGILVLDKS